MKKVTAMLVVIALCLSCTACGGENCSHQYEGKITRDATCAEKGIQTFTCALCNNSYTQEMPTVGHTFGATIVTKEATCTAEGEKTATCSVCGVTDVVELIPKVEHTYVEKVTKAATCTAEGEKTATCSVCGVTDVVELIPKVEHTYVEKVTKTATCNDEGEKTFTCSVCNDNYTEIIKKTGHNYSQKTIRDVTCTNDGEKKMTCSVCGDSYIETIKSTGHKWVAATCDKARHCTACSQTEGTELGHSYQGGKCVNCGAGCVVTMGQDLPRRVACTYGEARATLEFSKMDYTITQNNDGTVNVDLTFTISVISYNNEGDPLDIFFKCYLGDKKVVRTFYAVEGRTDTSRISFTNLPVDVYKVYIY